MVSDILVENNPQMFKGVRKISEHQQKLFYYDTVPGSALPYRRTPFHLRKELEKEIQRQSEEDIIKEAAGPTPWVSPIVVTQRKSGAIRLLVDMWLANKIIKREWYPMPTFDDLVTDLNGASVFLCVDLNDAYHQVELDPESRHLTNFPHIWDCFVIKDLTWEYLVLLKYFRN